MLQKCIKNQWILMIFEFSSWSLLGSILDQFWLHFASQNPTKSVPRALQSRSKKWSKNLLSLGSIFKWFLIIFGPKWRYFFAAVKSQKSEKSEPWAQNVIQAFRTGSQALKILKNHAKMKGEITFFQEKGNFCQPLLLSFSASSWSSLSSLSRKS